MAKRKARITLDYREYTTSSGEVVKVHSVPPPIVKAIRPKNPKPQRPWIVMKTKTGEQKRPIRKDDDGWDDYQVELSSWEEERDELQDAASLVLALRSYEVDDGLTILDATVDDLPFPDYVYMLVKQGIMEPLPDDEYLLKSMWLETCVLGQHDTLEINWIVQELGGTPKEMVQQIKDNFRNRLLGNVTRAMEQQIEDGDGTEGGTEL